MENETSAVLHHPKMPEILRRVADMYNPEKSEITFLSAFWLTVDEYPKDTVNLDGHDFQKMCDVMKSVYSAFDLVGPDLLRKAAEIMEMQSLNFAKQRR